MEDLQPVSALTAQAREAAAVGDHAEACELFHRVGEALVARGHAAAAIGPNLEAAVSSAALGDEFLAADYFDRATLLALECGVSLETGGFAFARAECSLARGNSRAALSEYALAMERFIDDDRLVDNLAAMSRYAYAVETIANAIDAADAHQLVVRAVREIPELGVFEDLLIAQHLRSSGRAQRRCGQLDDAFSGLLEASELFRTNGMLREAAELDLEVGSLALELGDEDYARVCFIEARMGFTALGMRLEADRSARAGPPPSDGTRRLDSMSRAAALPGIEYLNLGRTLSQEGRFPHALLAYGQAIAILRARHFGEALVVGQYEAVVPALELSDFSSANRLFTSAQRDARKYGVVVAGYADVLMGHMFAIARGEERDVARRIAHRLEATTPKRSIDETLALMQLMAKLHDRTSSPLRAASFLRQQCDVLERLAMITRSADDLANVAYAYFDHAQYLYSRLDASVAEAQLAADGEDRERWEAFLQRSVHFAPGNDLATAIRHEVLSSCNASDWWGPGTRQLRLDVGVLRTQVLLELHDISAAVREARRCIPIAEMVGAPDRVAELLAISASARPDLGFGR